MKTDSLVLKLRLKFDIFCMVSEDRRVLQIEEDPSMLYDISMCHTTA